MFFGREFSERITQSALNLLVYRLQGGVCDRTAPGKPGPKAAKQAKVRV